MMRKLRVALLGLADDGQHYLSAIGQDDLFELVAISDRNVNLSREISENTGIRSYEDNRSLIVELSHDGLDALFIALEPHESYEFVQLSAQSNIAVFHKAPFSRNISDARSLVDRFRTSSQPLVIARTLPSDLSWSVATALSEEVGQVQFAMAEVASVNNADGWRGDHVRAGGGVLLHGAYPQLDLLVSVMGVPEEAFAQCAKFGQAGDVLNYDTEDMATLSLRFSSHRLATLSAYRNAPISHSRIRWVGPDGVVETTAESFTVESSEHMAEDVASPFAKDDGISKAVHEFGVALSSGMKPASTGEDHLASMAVLEAAYLSSRTGAPESVSRFLSAD